MCPAKQPHTYLKGQGHTGSLNVKMQPFVSGLEFSYAWKDFKIIWLKCLPYQDNVSRETTTPLSQRSRSLWSHLQFHCIYACFRVLAVISLGIEGFSNNTAQVLSISRRHVTWKEPRPYLKGQGHTCSIEQHPNLKGQGHTCCFSAYIHASPSPEENQQETCGYLYEKSIWGIFHVFLFTLQMIGQDHYLILHQTINHCLKKKENREIMNSYQRDDEQGIVITW